MNVDVLAGVERTQPGKFCFTVFPRGARRFSLKGGLWNELKVKGERKGFFLFQTVTDDTLLATLCNLFHKLL